MRNRIWHDGPGDFEECDFMGREGAPAVARRHLCYDLFGGNKQGPAEVRTQETKLPEWVDAASRSNYDYAKQIAGEMKGPYTGQRTADLTQNQLANIAAAQANVGSTNNAYQSAQDTTRNFLNYNAPQVQAGQIANTNLSPYMNPYTQSVTNYGLDALEQSRLQALNTGAARASGAGAFGGSRHGVADAATNIGSATAAGKLAADYGSQNFLNAQTQAGADIGRRYTADVANQNASLSSGNLALSAAQNLGTQTTAGQDAYLKGLSQSQAYQGQQQYQTQQELDAARALYGEQQQFPVDKLKLLQGALTNSPYGNTVLSTQPGPTSNPGMQAAGLGLSVASLIPSFATMFSGSDRRLKTDIQKVGVDEPTGLALFGYRYRGDPKSYPKVVGPMAQDVAKKFPDQVAKVGNYLAVKSNFLAPIVERASHD